MKCKSLSIFQPTPIHKFPSISHLAELHHRQNSSKEPKQHQFSCNHHHINHIKQHHTFFIFSNLIIYKTTKHFATKKKVTINYILSLFHSYFGTLVFILLGLHPSRKSFKTFFNPTYVIAPF
jgi:hypothetical protein